MYSLVLGIWAGYKPQIMVMVMAMTVMVIMIAILMKIVTMILIVIVIMIPMKTVIAMITIPMGIDFSWRVTSKPLPLGKIIKEAIIAWANTIVPTAGTELPGLIANCFDGLPFLLVLFAFEMLTESLGMTVNDIIFVLCTGAM